MLEAIDQFREKGTLDELGIAPVRDAFANTLFPGTSVLQTRARYFLFVPWICLNIERRRIASSHAADTARRDEVKLIAALLAGGADQDGIIGVQARERVRRTASLAYWNGLLVMGIRRFNGSIDRYFRSLDGYYRANRDAVRGDDGELIGISTGNWHIELPDPPHGMLERAELALTVQEAEYLRDRIQEKAPDSLLAVGVSSARPVADYAQPWDLFAADTMPSGLHELLGFAHLFSDLTHGAQLLYNRLVARLCAHDRSDPEPEDHHTRLAEWQAGHTELASRLAATDRPRFWEVVVEGNPNVSGPTRSFVDAWWDLVVVQDDLAGSRRAQSLLTERERVLKRGLARLVPENVRAREQWRGTAGISQLDYRWPTVRTLITDIQEGLARA